VTSSGGVSRLAGKTDELGEAFDLLAAYDPRGGAFFERAGLGVSMSYANVSMTGSLAGDAASELRGWLARIDSDLGGEGHSIAIGTFPFDRSSIGHLLLGERIVRRTTPGETLQIGIWDDAVGPPRLPPFERVVEPLLHEAFTAKQLHESPSADVYADAVTGSVERIRAGDLRKVVLARTIEVDAERRLDPRRLAHRLRVVNQDAFTFAVPTPTGTLVGASPELLVSRFGREIRSNPLAGSAARSGDPLQDRENGASLLASAKDHEEHEIVVDAIAATLGPFCRELSWDPEPVLLETPNVWHLSTRFRGLLREPAPGVLELVQTLHPTPAIAGAPRSGALQTIAELEPFDRGAYAGPVGWVDASGDGEFAIALRCAVLRGERATLYAGAGIVAGSQPEAEVDETDRKFRAFLDALRWG
jgi:isochorismate synthase